MERERLTAKDFNPELWDIFDQYVHGDIDRRGFLDRAAKYAAAPVTAGMLLDMLNPKFAEAQQVAEGRQAHQDRMGRDRLAERLRQDQGVCLQARQRDRQAAGACS